jgi:hypothetical protein
MRVPASVKKYNKVQYRIKLLAKKLLATNGLASNLA